MAKELLSEIKEWLENDGYVHGVHYDEASIIDAIDEVLNRTTKPRVVVPVTDGMVEEIFADTELDVYLLDFGAGNRDKEHAVLFDREGDKVIGWPAATYVQDRYCYMSRWRFATKHTALGKEMADKVERVYAENKEKLLDLERIL